MQINLQNCGFRIFDSKNGLFVKEAEQTYVKEGTEMSRSVFFPITKEARDALYGQILHSYELTMEMEMGQRQEDTDFFLGDEDAPPERQYEPPPEEYAVSKGLFSGTSADTFSPGTPMTRGMFVRVLGNKASQRAEVDIVQVFPVGMDKEHGDGR